MTNTDPAGEEQERNRSTRSVRTVKTLAEVPGGYDRAVAELKRRLSLRYGVPFVVSNDRAEVVRGSAASGSSGDSRASRSEADGRLAPPPQPRGPS